MTNVNMTAWRLKVSEEARSSTCSNLTGAVEPVETEAAGRHFGRRLRRERKTRVMREFFRIVARVQAESNPESAGDHWFRGPRFSAPRSQ
jgi:hypothetical protein